MLDEAAHNCRCLLVSDQRYLLKGSATTSLAAPIAVSRIGQAVLLIVYTSFFCNSCLVELLQHVR